MLYYLINIGIFTGARIEEICSVKVVDIAAENTTIKDSRPLHAIENFQFIIAYKILSNSLRTALKMVIFYQDYQRIKMENVQEL